MSAFAALLLALVIGFVLSQFRRHDGQNRGEAAVARALHGRFTAPDYQLLNNVTLRLWDGTTQIDHILVSRFGLFVIETKDYSGWIFAGPKDRLWTQVLYRDKFRFQNPIRQNYKHARAVQELLGCPPDYIHSVVAFVGDAEFKTAVPGGIYSLASLLAYIEGQAVQVIPINRVQFCVQRLEAARLPISKATEAEHVLNLRRRFGNGEQRR